MVLLLLEKLLFIGASLNCFCTQSLLGVFIIFCTGLFIACCALSIKLLVPDSSFQYKNNPIVVIIIDIGCMKWKQQYFQTTVLLYNISGLCSLLIQIGKFCFVSFLKNVWLKSHVLANMNNIHVLLNMIGLKKGYI